MLAAVWSLAIKLFTTEFYLPDDPTSGIAWRSSPSWSNRELRAELPSPPSRIIAQSENGPILEGPYRLLVSWGWLTLLVAAGLSFVVGPRKRAQVIAGAGRSPQDQ